MNADHLHTSKQLYEWLIVLSAIYDTHRHTFVDAILFYQYKIIEYFPVWFGMIVVVVAVSSYMIGGRKYARNGAEIILTGTTTTEFTVESIAKPSQ